jgi:hypothetical protein
MIEVVEELGAAFEQAQKTYGKDKFTEAEVVELAARGTTPLMRKALCRMMRLGKAAEAEVMGRPYPAQRAILERMDGRAVEQHRAKAGNTGYQIVSLDEEAILDVAQHLLDEWAEHEPRRRDRKPLRVFQGKSGDLDSWLIPWVRSATPGVPSNLDRGSQVGRGKRFWDAFVSAVYDSDYLGAKVPGRRGASLEWLAAPEKDDNGRAYPLMRLQRVLSGFYDAPASERL